MAGLQCSRRRKNVLIRSLFVLQLISPVMYQQLMMLIKNFGCWDIMKTTSNLFKRHRFVLYLYLLFLESESHLSLPSAPSALLWRSIYNMGKELALLLVESPQYWSSTTYRQSRKKHFRFPTRAAELPPGKKLWKRCRCWSAKRW